MAEMPCSRLPLPFGRLLYAEPDAVANAIGYATFFSRLPIFPIFLSTLARDAKGGLKLRHAWSKNEPKQP